VEPKLTGELRRDPLSGRTVVIAPGRAARPGVARPRIEAATQAELDTCPFCAGREHMTPPETLRFPEQGAEGWQVRVVPNRYPAFERQDVVIHSPRHVRSFAELDDGEVELVADAWRIRANAARAEGFGYVQAVINEGRLAGASLAHSHSQLVWLREAPPAVIQEGDAQAAVSEILKQIQRRSDPAEFEVQQAGDVLAFCPPAGRGPYEVLITNPYGHPESGYDAKELSLGLRVLRDVIRRLRAVEGSIPWNAWLHTHDSDWHIELLPRLTVFAGIELGAGIYVNPLPPEEAARRLREAVMDPPARPLDR